MKEPEMKLLVPYDGSNNASLALRDAVRIAQADGNSEIYLLNVQPLFNRHIARFFSKSTLAGSVLQRGETVLRGARDILQGTGIRYRAAIKSGEVAPTILAYSGEIGADRIVLGTARKSALVRLLTGSLINTIVEEASIPVEVVAGERPGFLTRYGVPTGVGLGLTALLLAAD
jgi:nucleotide-binding universal stress UspA family protein